MFINERRKSVTSQVMEVLKQRIVLDFNGRMYYLNQVKGDKGEERFDPYLFNLAKNYPILRGLSFQHRTNVVQIDALVPINKTLFVYEVKNYSGNFYYRDGNIYSEAGTRVSNPMYQIERSEAIMMNILRERGLNYNVKAYIVYVAEDFTLYHAPEKDCFIYPGQIEKHIESIGGMEIQEHTMLIQCLLNHQVPDQRSKDIPDYRYEDLRKGVSCQNCGSFNGILTRQNFVCTECQTSESSQAGIIRMSEEYALLFPENKITTAIMHDWCAKIYSKQRIYRSMNSKFQKMGNNKGAYFSNSSSELKK